MNNIRNMDNLDILHEASQKLHHLEAIELSYLGPDAFRIFNGGTIRFKDVKRFHVSLNAFQTCKPFIIPLEFDHLEEIEFDSILKPVGEKWVEFVGK